MDVKSGLHLKHDMKGVRILGVLLGKIMHPFWMLFFFFPSHFVAISGIETQTTPKNSHINSQTWPQNISK